VREREREREKCRKKRSGEVECVREYVRACVWVSPETDASICGRQEPKHTQIQKHTHTHTHAHTTTNT
jgi:hypothetical protein